MLIAVSLGTFNAHQGIASNIAGDLVPRIEHKLACNLENIRDLFVLGQKSIWFQSKHWRFIFVVRCPNNLPFASASKSRLRLWCVFLALGDFEFASILFCFALPPVKSKCFNLFRIQMIEPPLIVTSKIGGTFLEPKYVSHCLLGLNICHFMVPEVTLTFWNCICSKVSLPIVSRRWVIVTPT